MSYRVEPLADHDLTSFSCGNDELDEWLYRHARTATGHGTRPYVLVAETGSVVGYFAIAPHYLAREDAPPRLARGAPAKLPAILLAKLALDSSVQGQGLGAELLVHALTTILDAARRAGRPGGPGRRDRRRRQSVLRAPRLHPTARPGHGVW